MQIKKVRGKKWKNLKRLTYMSRVNKLFKPKKEEPKLKKIFFEFCEATKVNGIYYLRKGKTRSIARCIINEINYLFFKNNSLQ